MVGQAGLPADGRVPQRSRLVDRVAALEYFDDDTQTATKAPLLSGPVARTASYPDDVDDPATAVRVLLARDGQVTADAVAELAGIDISDVEAWLGDEVFRDPDRRRQRSRRPRCI